jgi:signal peptidase II
MRLMVLTAAVVFAVDQILKWVVVHGLDLISRGVIEVAPPYLVLRMAWNTGINFGILSGGADWMRWVLIAVALAISVWVVLWVRKEGGRPIAMFSAGLLVGGALGNVVDRVIYGAVADFLNMSCCGIENPYAFNVADISIFVGAVGLILFAGGDGQRGKPRDAKKGIR